MKHFRIRRGEAPTRDHAPLQRLPTEVTEPRTIALTGDDFPDLRIRFAVKPGDSVRAGQTLFTDRRNPAVNFVSPVTGHVTETAFGPRRTLSICAITRDPGADEAEIRVPDAEARESPRATLLARGLWPAFRARPFGRIPAPDAEPSAIVVNAVHSVPQDPDPVCVLAVRQDEFQLGLILLTRLTEGPVHLCHSPGAMIGGDVAGVVRASFDGSAATGLDGTLIDRLCPVIDSHQVWSIGYQDVAAIGHLFQHGSVLSDRIVTITGATRTGPHLVRTRLGARLGDLTDTEGKHILTGDPRDGRHGAYLGYHDRRITLLDTPRRTPPKVHSRRRRLRPGALIPTRALEKALAVDLLAVPLLRALATGDAEAAVRLGCLGLIEEDVAALSRSCTSGADYGALLRRVLDDLEAERP